jgi:hypothetical protein
LLLLSTNICSSLQIGNTDLKLETFSSKRTYHQAEATMLAFVLWCILFVLCWPLALIALILYPIVWLFLLPFRIVGIAVEGVLKLVWAIVTLPARLLSAPGRV